jgi:hypothetical protein
MFSLGISAPLRYTFARARHRPAAPDSESRL